ncbi:MAG: hypothetical protein JJ959_10475 [Nisaea sp.]|uniref:hypothetical protein n=1 Tax=Nisaea sp. TaxID=2024842 RepID=UPI001B1334D0|nr:hypothetical protein [Nisaea sp.]MBO6560955.1 hypothetical protein [Nisaea sp.]
MTISAKRLVALAALLLAACSSDPPPSGKLPPNPERRAAEALTLIDTVPTGLRCKVSGGSATPLALTTPRLVALSQFGKEPVIDCFADGFFRLRKAVPARPAADIVRRFSMPGMVDPAFGPDQDAKQVTGGSAFPQWVRITLQESSFQTAAERDRYYAAEAIRIQQDWGEIELRLNAACDGYRKTEAKGLILMSPECRKARRILEERRAADLTASEVNRRQSTIR